MIRWLVAFACIVVVGSVGFTGDSRPSRSQSVAHAVGGPGALFAFLAKSHAPQSLPDPFPIQRLRATENQFQELRKQFEPDDFVRLPRDVFESRVQAAAQAAHTSPAPRITAARYQAALNKGELTGTAEIDLVHDGTQPRFVPLEPFRLATRTATWNDGNEAVFGVPVGGSGVGVWVDHTGLRTLKFAWSAASITEPGELRFELRVPEAPLAILELELPARQVPTVPSSEVLLTGPFPVKGKDSSRLWRVRFGGRTRLDLSVRPLGNPGVATVATLAARYDIAPGQLTGVFEYVLRPAKGTVGEWLFTIDPGLRITDVMVNNRAGWAIDPQPEADQPRVLRVTLRQPGAGGKVLISTVAPFPDPTRPAHTPLPAVRPVGAIVDEESLEIRFTTGSKLEAWNPGDYRLTESQMPADQTRVLNLTGTLLPANVERGFRRLPIVGVGVQEPDIVATEHVLWRLEGARAAATVRVALRVRRGPLFAFTMKTPPGYVFVPASSGPNEMIAHAGPVAGGVLVELARPLTSGQSIELVLEFRGPALRSPVTRLPFPNFAIAGVTERSGLLLIYPGPEWETDARAGVGTTRASWFDPFIPTGPSPPRAAFRYRGNDPDGTVELWAARPIFEAAMKTRVEQLGAEVVGITSFAIRVKSGALPALLVAEPDGGFAARTWSVTSGANAIASAVQVPIGAIVRRCVPAAFPWPAQLWVVAFARPATGEITVETTATLPGGANVEAFAGVKMLGANLYQLVPRTEPVPTANNPERSWNFSGVYLMTTVRSGPEVLAIFGGSVVSAVATTLPIVLPEGARMRGATVEGRWIEPGGLRVSPEGVLYLPLPAEAPARFEVRYRLQPDSRGPLIPVRSAEPRLPGVGTGGRMDRWWVFAPDVLPAWPAFPRDRSSMAEQPQLLGDYPISDSAALVLQTSEEVVCVADARVADAAGMGFAALLVALAWTAGRRTHPLCAVLLAVILLGTGLVGQLGPPWWQRAATVPMVLGLLAMAGMVLARGRPRLPLAAIAVLTASAFTFSHSTAQPLEPVTIVLLPPDANGLEEVIAPKTALDRLAAIASPPPPGVVLTAADYAAHVDDGIVRVTAKFTVRVMGSESVATLPLSDARLERVTVNGKPAFPAAPRLGAIAIPLPGAGWHQIEASFVVSVGGSGSEREFRFGVPEVPSATLAVDVPGDAKQVQVVGRIGRQTNTNGKPIRTEADLGAVKAVHVRWRDGAGGTALVKVREGCIWDVSENGAELTACYLVRVEQGTVSSLPFEIPSELELLGVTVRSLDPGSLATLRDWSMRPARAGFQNLRLDLQGPTAGRMLVILTLAPRNAVTERPLLRFPKPLSSGNKPEPDASYGLRAKGVVIEELTRVGAIDFSADALTRDFADVGELWPSPRAAVRVFRPIGATPTELRPTLRPMIEAPAFALDTLWHVGVRRADATGTVRWSNKQTPPLLELTFPNVQIAEVKGTDVAWWSQAGERVQVWLRRSAKEGGELTWVGSSNRAAGAFDAVTPTIAGETATSNTLRLRAAEGFALGVERDRGWIPAPTPDDPLTFRATGSGTAAVRVTVSPVGVTLRAQELGWLSPLPRPKTNTADPLTEPGKKAIAAKPEPAMESVRASESESPPAPNEWMGPVTIAMTWFIGFGLLAIMSARFPRSTWPEQFGLLGGLFGIVVLGGWWIGLAVWSAARLVWLSGVTLPQPARQRA